MIEVTQGTSPLVLGLPHTGTDVPPEIWADLNANGRVLADTDWHIHDLYRGLVADLTTVRTPIHRFVIDVNRDPKGSSLYPGQNTTTLCPLTDFESHKIYRDGRQPGLLDVTRRLDTYHTPYHEALRVELARVKAIHGFAILYDCHSIRSHIPFLFDGRLPDFNIGTNSGASCDPAIETLVSGICATAEHYSSIQNGRFKGGWTTRRYGHPGNGFHAIQMELAQSTYCTEAPPWTMISNRVDTLRAHLTKILYALSNWRPK